jgi:hypothetical protein
MKSSLRQARRLGRAYKPKPSDVHEIQDCFADVDAALRRVERAVSQLKAEAALLRIARALSEASLVPNDDPVAASEPVWPRVIVLGR